MAYVHKNTYGIRKLYKPPMLIDHKSDTYVLKLNKNRAWRKEENEILRRKKIYETYMFKLLQRVLDYSKRS